MRSKLAFAFVAIAATATAADAPMQQLAGRYTHRFKNGDTSGEVYYTTDVVEILPLDQERAVVNLDLNFFNGHSCSVYGIATLNGGRLIYREEEPNPWSDGGCQLEIWRDGNKLRWAEAEGTSCQSNCGARGGLSVGDISYRSRRKIDDSRARQLREDPESLGQR